MIELRRAGPEPFVEVLDTVIEIYTEAMNPPREQLAGRRSIMQNHATYPDFTCILAEHRNDGIVGFAYGFHGGPGQWWHDVVRRALAERAGERAALEWLGDSFEVAEIHIRPAHQNRGLGRRLLRTLVEGRPERSAVLSTHDQPTAARHLYAELGFVDLLPAFVFPGGYEHYAIVGAPLPLR